ncbi:MAG: thiamine phosphate synthase [Planctomycetota bacterium]
MQLPPAVVALSPGTLTPAELDAFPARVRAVARAGVRGLLLREPALDERDFLGLARELRAVLDEEGGWLGVHDRAHLARLAGADAVHLGFRSLPPERIPAAWREHLAVGFSGHAADAPEAWEPADYLFFGPVRDTPSKRGLQEPTGFDGLSAACARAVAPIWALGGLAPDDVRAALAAGARGVAVLGGILGSREPAERAASFAAAAREIGA